MKRGNLEMGVLVAVAAVAALGALFMFSGSDEPTGLASFGDNPQFSQTQSACLMGCYQDLQMQSRNNDYLSRQKLESCLNYCQSIPKAN